MTVNSTTSSTYTPGATTGTTSATPQQSLGQEDFLQLLATQLSAQDPMKPMDDTAFISQMANFSSLQQMQTLNTQFTAYAKSQQAQSAPDYLNKQVTLTDPNTGNPVTGVPSAVNISGSYVTLIIDGQNFPLSAVTSVSNIPTASTASILATAAASAVTGALGSN